MAKNLEGTSSSNAEEYSYNIDNRMMEIEDQFLSGVPAKCFLTESKLDYVLDNLDEVMRRTIYHKLNEKYAIKCSNQVSFVKIILSAADARRVEISLDVYVLYLKLLDATTHPNDFHYVHYSVDRRPISIKEKSCVISNGTTGLSVWQAGRVLAQYCEENRTKFANKRIIELGSGLGFTGISTILNCQPRSYCFTDVHENVLEYMVENVRMNLGDRMQVNEHSTHSDEIVLNAMYENCELTILKLPWEEELSRFIDGLKLDFILAADVTYDPSLFHSFCTCLIKLKELNEKCEIILSCTVRNEDTLKLFFECLHEHELYETLLTVYETWNSSYNQECQVQLFSVARVILNFIVTEELLQRFLANT